MSEQDGNSQSRLRCRTVASSSDSLETIEALLEPRIDFGGQAAAIDRRTAAGLCLQRRFFFTVQELIRDLVIYEG